MHMVRAVVFPDKNGFHAHFERLCQIADVVLEHRGAGRLYAVAGADELERLSLGVLQPKPGRPRYTFGYSSVAAPSPVVDLLAPAPLKQQELLSEGTALMGITWSASGAEATAAESGKPVTSITSTVSPQLAAPSSTSTQRGSIAERLRQLTELRTQGLINEQEYEELRRKILADL